MNIQISGAPETTDDRDPGAKSVAISVNFRPVTLETRKVSGLHIKEAAIAQGVVIQIDFVLFRDLGNGRRDPVRDDEIVHVHRGESFEAVPGDDNS